MTREQMNDIVFHPRNEDGSICIERPESAGVQMDFQNMCYHVWRMREPDVKQADLDERFRKLYPTAGFKDGC